MLHPLVIRTTIHIEEKHKIRLPVIYTKNGILKSYLDYSIYKRNKSESWIDASARAICLLVEFLEFNKTHYQFPADLFIAFADILFTGTVNDCGEDITGLRWKRRRLQDGNKIISYITMYSDWLCQNKGMSNKENLNPWTEATSHEEQMNWAAYSHKHKNSFLGHTWSQETAKRNNKLSRSVRYEQDFRDGNSAQYRFPDDHIDKLIHLGFVKQGISALAPAFSRLELRDILITILLHFGGLRRSEPFHIWLEDISLHPESPDEALVRVYEPEIGRSPTSYTNGRIEMRKETLAKNFQMLPRNKYEKSKKIFSGWKSNKLSPSKDNYLIVNWFEPSAGELFLFYWRLYIVKQRVSPHKDRQHPYAFTNQYGDPYSIDAFDRKHKKAAERIGLRVEKELGTTPHGHRYAYINRLEKAGVSNLVIANAVNHKSVKAQDAYKSLSPNETRAELRRLECKTTIKIIDFKGNHE
ncbi:gamma-mobile-trio recombinase GmtY [Shewanella psychromarinicola]|uniref:Site-specific integrase n=1 Tax=Shewanella psychromarinicola TaxID=2487742 RepID=A0A3N4E5A4_9GAMM|nr:gamma-mobile-trio recombinase GmtY [Shewanella psychromarinicola]AZG34805.1 site-specific integrase [Shewanella psychromarinicola]MCL1083759.1 site-specific integrase [Shewanella psychromarinicola]RPA33405.1 site-specific integrase [Shewanella psychromarinicola]